MDTQVARPRAVNPQTGAVLEFDGTQWGPAQAPAQAPQGTISAWGNQYTQGPNGGPYQLVTSPGGQGGAAPQGPTSRAPAPMSAQSLPRAVNPQTGETLVFNGTNWVAPPPNPQAGQGSLADSAINGLTFGLGDEAAGALGGVADWAGLGPQGSQGTFSGGYDRVTQNIRNKTADYADRHPYLSAAGNIAGGLATTLPLGATALGAKALGLTGDTMLGRIGAGMASGAGIGAGSGFAQGEGGLDNRISGAETGAGLGLAMGAAAPVVGAIAGKAVGATGRGLMKLRGPLREATNLMGHGAPGATTAALSPHLLATKILAEGVGADNLTPAAIAAAGPNATLAEMGPNLSHQAAYVAGLPGDGQKIVTGAMDARLAGRGGRINARLDAGLGPAIDVEQTAADISEQQAAAAKPLYDAIRNVAVADTPNLRMVLGSQAGKRAIVAGQHIAEGFGQSIDPQYPTVGALDYVKRAFDDQIGAAQRGGKNALATALTNQKNLLVKELDAQAPEYAAARNAYAGHAAVKDALEAGEAAFDNHQSPASLARQLAAYSRSEMIAFQQGARAKIAQIMGTARNDPAAAVGIFQKGWNAEKLALIAGKSEAKRTLDLLRQEHNLTVKNTLIRGGSETFARGAAEKSIAQHSWFRRLMGNIRLAVAVSGARGAARVGALHAFEGLVDSHDEVRNAQVAAILAKALSKTGPTRDALIKSLQEGIVRIHKIDSRANGLSYLLRALIASGNASATPMLTRSMSPN